MKKQFKISIIIFILLLVLILIITKPSSPIQIITCILVTLIFISPMIIGEPVANKVYNATIIENVTIKKQDYEKIISKYSAAMLYKILSGEVDSYSIILTIEALKQKNKIKIENDEIKVIDKNTKNLSQTEKYVLSKLIEKTSVSQNEFQKNLTVETDRHKLKFPRKNKYGIPLIKKILLIEIPFVIINIILVKYNLDIFSIKLTQNTLSYIISFLLFIIPILLLSVVPIIYITSIATTNINIDITKVNKIKSQLLALKNYTKKDTQIISDWKNHTLYLNILMQDLTITKYYNYIDITK